MNTSVAQDGPTDGTVSDSDRSLELPAEPREWSSVDGRKFSGSLVGFLDREFQRAEFLGDDGQSFKVPIERFTQKDQEWMRRFFDAWISNQSPAR